MPGVSCLNHPLLLSLTLHYLENSIRNVQRACEKKKLNLLVIDEAHLFVQFGLYFRDEFLALKDSLFKTIICNEIGTLVPILFMTATATKRTIDHLTLMTDLSFTSQNCFWPSAEGMLAKKELVRFQYTSRSFRVFKTCVKRLYDSDDISTKWILFSNTRILIEKLYQSIRAYFDASSYGGDIITITGTM